MPLTRILPDQVTKHWEVISFAIENSLPPFAVRQSGVMNNVLESLLLGKLECWVATNKSGEIKAIATTQILEDDISKCKSLLLYSVYGFSDLDESIWKQSFKTVSQYARQKGCQKITCYTDLEYIKEMSKKFNSEVRYFASFNL